MYSIKNIIIILITGLLGLLLYSCSKSNTKKEDSSGKVLAKVNANNLYLEDLKLLTPKGLSKADSIAYIQAIIKKWAYNEIFYQQAVNYLTDEELDVTKELEEYKKDLLSYKFQKKLIDEKLDTTITDNQIEEYYNNNSQNFVLKTIS